MKVFRRKSTFLFYLFIYLCSIAQAQESIDSLLELLPKASNEDKIEIYSSLSSAYFRTNIELAEDYSIKALALAKSLDKKQVVADVLHEIGRIKKHQNNAGDAIDYFNKSIKIKLELEDLLGVSKSYSNIGDIHLYRGDWDNALIAADKVEEYARLAEYTRGLAIAYNLKGNIFNRKAIYDKANIFYQKSLKMFEKEGDDNGVSVCLNNIALIYQNLDKHEEALEYFIKAYKLRTKLNDIKGVAEAANNIGNFYSNRVETVFYKTGEYIKKDGDSAISYYSQAYDKFHIVGNLLGQISSLNNLAIIHYYAKNYNLALDNFKVSMKLLETIDSPYEKANTYMPMALCYREMGDYKTAKKYAVMSVEVAQQGTMPEMLMMGYKYLASIQDSLRDYKDALESFRNYLTLQDCLRDEQSRKVVEELQTQYQTEKKEQEIVNQKMLNEKQLEINKRQKTQLYLSVIGVFIVLLFLILMIRQYLQKRKANNRLQIQNEEISQQKEEIETQRDEIYNQKELIEDQQHGIMDSIQYARRIQEAILPQSDTMLDVLGPDHFVLFKPRDIVSGDFYWMGRVGNDKIVVAADCTGHGVPGAFMSMLGTAFLNEIVNSGGQIPANKILNQLRDHVITSLRQTGKAGEQKDGMDVSLFIVNKERDMIDFAGANNPVLIVRPVDGTPLAIDNPRISVQVFTNREDGKDYQVITIKGDKMPIGIYAETKSFENIQFKLQKGDAVYAFSDGYQDQFGGPKNKKFMVKNLKQLFVDSYNKEMLVQQLILDESIENWKNQGDSEQIDDILVIGMRVR